MAKPLKSRSWWFIGYPESLPPNWLDVLTSFAIPSYISPLHDKDIDSLGNFKKAHFHIIVCFPNPTTFNNVNDKICKPLNCPIPQPCLALDSAYAYLTHRYNSDKAQYAPSDIIFLNGASPSSVDSSGYHNDLFYAIEHIISEEHPRTLKDLVSILTPLNNADMLTLVRSHPYYFACLLKD